MRTNKKGKALNTLLLLTLFLSCVTQVQAANMFSNVKDFICTIAEAFEAIGGSLVSMMFLYGGLTYIYGSAEPAARKKGKSICIHAIIGGLIIVLASDLIPQAASSMGISGGGCP